MAHSPQRLSFQQNTAGPHARFLARWLGSRLPYLVK